VNAGKTAGDERPRYPAAGYYPAPAYRLFSPRTETGAVDARGNPMLGGVHKGKIENFAKVSLFGRI
jgi:hypothetical protein